MATTKQPDELTDRQIKSLVTCLWPVSHNRSRFFLIVEILSTQGVRNIHKWIPVRCYWSGFAQRPRSVQRLSVDAAIIGRARLAGRPLWAYWH
ncbi:MAG: hypothetical protein QOJ99_1060 [Bryobacterales bacterium]|jgi:hypothetical protein|nr:hypothetical protein [Bryobacterales bacterium]